MRLIPQPGPLPIPTTALVVPVGASSPSTTGRVMGRFALPVAAAWGHRVLRPGSYTFVVPGAAFPAGVSVRGGGDSAVFVAASVRQGAGGPLSRLLLGYERSGYHVRSLRLRHAGMVLHFGPAMPRRRPRPERRGRGTFTARLRRSGNDPREFVLTLNR